MMMEDKGDRALLTREEINAFGDAIKAALLDGDDAILIEVGAVPPVVDCHLATCTATVSGMVGKLSQSFTSNAVSLTDAIWLARGKLREARKKHEARAIEARRAETQGGSVHESAVAEGHAPHPNQDTPHE
ncbi:MAG: hypothetical protein ACTHNA_14005 [Sphingopyxis terrae]|uniref:hypothetical protein n=1 Tax=Sphingopyxis terrae TaxID=33052 RepID=UPI003F7DDBBD